jgi:hypothetical protein
MTIKAKFKTKLTIVKDQPMRMALLKDALGERTLLLSDQSRLVWSINESVPPIEIL